MKCTNKYKILLPVLILALLLLTGCTQRSDVAEAYQLYETSDNYAARRQHRNFWLRICASAVRRILPQMALMQHSHRVRVYFLWKMR